MRIATVLISLSMLPGGCGRGEPAGETKLTDATVGNQAPESAAEAGGPRWDLQSSGEGIALALLGAGGRTVVRLFCPAGTHGLIVNVPAFRPVGSEERMSLGSGSDAVALVADIRGDALRGGVSGAGPVPDKLPALVGGPVAINYGSQNSGPHAAPPAQWARIRDDLQRSSSSSERQGSDRPGGCKRACPGRLPQAGRQDDPAEPDKGGRDGAVLGGANRGALRHLHDARRPEGNAHLDPVHRLARAGPVDRFPREPAVCPANSASSRLLGRHVGPPLPPRRVADGFGRAAHWLRRTALGTKVPTTAE
jgi:hypothetical protein